MSLRIFSYILLVISWLPLLIVVLQYRGIFRSPIFTTVVIAIFFINIIGSIVVFIPELNIYEMEDIWTVDFFFIHLIQVVFFYAYLPVFFRQSDNIHLSTPDAPIGRLFFLSFSFISLCFVVFPEITTSAPIWEIINFGSNSVLMDSRISFFEDGHKFIWIYKIAIYVLPQIITVILYVRYLQQGTTITFVYFLAVLLPSIIFSLLFLHKTPMLILFLSLFIAYGFFKKRFSPMIVLRLLISLILLLIVLYLVYFYNTFLSEGSSYVGFFVGQILNRLFGAYPISTAQAIILANESGYWMGEANSMIYFFGQSGDSKGLTQLIHMTIFGYEGAAPASALGSAYVDYGYAGVFIVNVCLLLVILILDTSLKSVRYQVFRVPLTIYFMLTVMFISMTSFNDVFTSAYQILTFSGLYLLYKLSTMRVQRC